LSGPSESLADTLLDEIRVRNQALATLVDLAVDEASKATATRTLRGATSLVRHAQYRVRVAEQTQSATKTRERLAQLLEEQRTVGRRLGLDTLRQKIERRPWEAEAPLAADAVDVGTPRRTEGRAAVLRTGTESLHFREAVTVGVLLIIGVVLLSYWPRGLRRWVALWPEQLAAAVVLALALEGFSLVGCALLLVAVLGRAVLATRWVRRRLFRRVASA
ncbi:MAG TPA: hypothetical protein VHR72_07710, partial [Gemmataceae bacterium]|nr:hypothetical protein [Gemmataceae bacterium]